MNTSRTVLLIGTALVGGWAIGQSVTAQAPGDPGPPAPPQVPRCIMKGPPDCKLPNGHPDLTGLWTIGGPADGLGSGAAEILFAGRGSNFRGFDTDGGLYRQSTVDSGDVNAPNFPIYKPEYWDTITDLEYEGNFKDPQQFCLPQGVPRLGAPSQVIALKDEPLVLLFYNGGYTRDAVRQIWTDGRPHNPVNVAAETWNGDSVGHWEGNTLVIETIGMTDESWLHKNGYIHGFNTKVTEWLTRR